MKIRNTLAVATLVFAAGAVSAEDKAVVEYRENLMKVIGGHMGSIVAIVKGEVPHGGDLAYHAAGLAAAAPKALPAFEQEAMTDDSHALAKIWSDWATFEKASRQLESTSADLLAAVEGGNQAAIGAALGEVGKSCKGCHDDFTRED